MRCILIAGLGIGLAAGMTWADPKAEFAKLEDQMEGAFNRYVAVMDAVQSDGQPGDGEREAPTGPASRPIDPRVEVLRRMDALVDASKGTPHAAEIAGKAFYWSAAFHIDAANLFERFERVAERDPSGAELDEAVFLAGEVYRSDASPKDWIGTLTRIAEATTAKEVRLGAWQTIGRIHLESGELKPARLAFARVSELDPDSELGQEAKGYIHEIDHLQVGMIAPDFTAPTLEGGKVALKELRGKVVLLDFWATWCGPCLGEIPHLRAAAKRFADQPFVIVGVSLDDIRELLVATIEQQEVPGIQTWEESGRENPVATLYNAQVLPTSFLIDAEGVIRGRNVLGEEIIPAVEKLIGVSSGSHQPP